MPPFADFFGVRSLALGAVRFAAGFFLLVGMWVCVFGWG